MALWNLSRNGRLAQTLGRPIGRSGYFVEQLTFLLSLLPHLVVERPDVVYVSDVVLANLLRVMARPLGYTVLFCNSGPVSPHLLHRWRHVHQTSSEHLDAAKEAGVPLERQTLLPLGVPIAKQLVRPTRAEQLRLRKVLRVPTDGTLMLSVGAINTTRKRMDYVIREVASLPEPRPYLLLLGAREAETDGLTRLGRSLLDGGFDARSVSKEEVNDYYRAADMFALASLDEGFGLVYAEALAHGLPCLVHDYPTARFVLSDMGIYGDLSKEGGLARMIAGLKPDDCGPDRAYARHASVYERFSWDRLRPRYVAMFLHCAGINRYPGEIEVGCG